MKAYVQWLCVYAVVPCKAAPQDAELSGSISAFNSILLCNHLPLTRRPQGAPVWQGLLTPHPGVRGIAGFLVERCYQCRVFSQISAQLKGFFRSALGYTAK